MSRSTQSKTSTSSTKAKLRTLNDPFILPANVDYHGDLLLIPDLSARVTLIDKDDKTILLGKDEEWRKKVVAEKNLMRHQPQRWVDGASSTLTTPVLTPKETYSSPSGFRPDASQNYASSRKLL